MMKTLISGIPTETYTAARKIYNIQHVYLRIGDQLNQILIGIDLPLLDPSAGLGYETIFRLALVTAFQYAESLPDPVAVQVIHQRMDWKYALYLPVNYPGISAAALCGFRSNLFSSLKGQREYEVLLNRLAEFGLLANAQKQQPLDAGAVFQYICALTRLYWLKQAMKAALGMLVVTEPDWLRGIAQPHWYEQYRPIGAAQAAFVQNGSSLDDEARRTGSDAFRLLQAAQEQLAPQILERIELRNLRRKVEEQFIRQGSQYNWQPPGCSTCTCNYPLDSHL